MADDSYLRIVAYYETCLEQHREGPRAVDWKSRNDAQIRYNVMLDLIREARESITLLDFGCGLAGLKEHISLLGLDHIDYSGLELSEQFATSAHQRYPDTTIYLGDILSQSPPDVPTFDYIVMNGIFTRKHDLSNAEMTSYFETLTSKVFALTRKGLAFNVMSKCVDWESDELFHAHPDQLTGYICNNLTKHFALRNDYGLFETTYYLYRDKYRGSFAATG